MNIEVPLNENDVVEEDDAEKVEQRNSRDVFLLNLTQLEDDEEEGRVLDERHPFCLVIFPWRQEVRVVHVERAAASSRKGRSRQFVDSSFASTWLHHNTHGVCAPGGDLWTKEVRSYRHMYATQIRCTCFDKAKEARLGRYLWSLDVRTAVTRETEVDVRIVEQEKNGDEEEDDQEEEKRIAVVNGRVMGDGWVELLIETSESSPHRIVLMWHPSSDTIKRWHLSSNARLSFNNAEYFPSMIVDNGRGFLSLGSHMSDPDLLAMVMVHSGATAADNLCSMNQMDRCTIPLRALEASLVHRQLDTVSFYLTSSINVVDQWLTRKPLDPGYFNSSSASSVSDDFGVWNLTVVAKDLEEAVGLILRFMCSLRQDDSSLQNVQYCQQLAFMLNEFLIKMLTMLVSVDKSDDEELKALAQCVHRLYLRLKESMNSKSAEKRRQSLRKLLKERTCGDSGSESLHNLYAIWDRLARTEVVVDGLQRNVVPIMVEYLSQQRNERVTAAEIRNIGIGEVRLQLRRQSWDSAHFLLLQMGLNARDCLEEILWETGSLVIRNFLLRELSARGMLSSELECLWHKLECLEEVYSVHNIDRFLEERQTKDGEAGVKESTVEKLFKASTRRLSDCVPRYRSSSSYEGRPGEEEEETVETDESLCNGLVRPGDKRRVAYHRFRLFALRHISDVGLTRMLVDQSLGADLERYLERAREEVAQYLLDYLDVGRLTRVMNRETAEWLLHSDSLRLHVPSYYRQLLLDFLARRFDLFETEADLQTQCYRCVQHLPVTELVHRLERLLPFVGRVLIDAGATTALYRLCTASEPGQMTKIADMLQPDHPVWARVAVEAVRSNRDIRRLSPEMAETLLGATGSPRACLTAALLMGASVEEVMAEHGIQNDAILSLLRGGAIHTRLSAASTADMYCLLAGNAGVSVERVFGWQPTCRVAEDGTVPVFHTVRPHFSEPRLIDRFGNRERLGFTYYLLRQRPVFAYISLMVSTVSRYGCKGVRSEQRRREAVLWAHQLALENFNEPALVGACLAFTHLLKTDTSRLRCHLLCLRTIYGWRRATCQSWETAEGVLKSMNDWVMILTCYCSTPGPPSVHNPEVDRLVAEYETAILWRHRDHLDDDRRLADVLLDWAQVLYFAHLHQLHLPGHLLERLASRGNWLSLLVVAQLFPFQKADLRCILSRFDNVGLRDHISRVIDKSALVAPTSDPERPSIPAAMMTLAPTMPPRDRRLQFYTSLGVDVQSPRAQFTGLVPDVAPAAASPDTSLVASSYDSRTSDSCPNAEPVSEEEFDAARLMASVDALSNDSLFELLLTVRQPRALLAYAMALSHPLLAILSICTAAAERLPIAAEERFSFVSAFLIASLPYRMKEVYVTESWGGSLKVSWTLDEALELFQQTLHRHSFWELENTAHIFFIGNPMDSYFAYIRHTLQTRDAVKRKTSLRSLITRREEWLKGLQMRGLDQAEGVEDELSFTQHMLVDSALWLCAEVLHDLSAEMLLTVTEELGCAELELVFGRATPHGALMDRLRRVLCVLLKECRLSVDASNFTVSEDGLMDSCSGFVADLVRQCRFQDARRLIGAMDGPAAPRERLAEVVDRAEAEERHRLSARFSPRLCAALGRVLRYKKEGEEVETGRRARGPSAVSQRRRRMGTGVKEDPAEELLFRPAEDPDWEAAGGDCSEEVHRLLDAGRLGEAYRRSPQPALCDDLRFLLAAVGVACGEVPLSALPATMVRDMTERRVRPRSSLGVPVSGRRRGSIGLPGLSSTPKMARTSVVGPARPTAGPEAVTRLLEDLPMCLEHGKGMAERVYMMHRVAVAVDAPYAMLARSPPLSVLCKILAGTIVDKLTIADFFVRASVPPLELLNRYLLRVALMLEQHAIMTFNAPALAAVDVTLTPTVAQANGGDSSAPVSVSAGSVLLSHKLSTLVPLPDEVEMELGQLLRSFPTKVNTATTLAASDLLKVAPRPLALGELFLDTLRRCLFDASAVSGGGPDVDYRLLVELVVLAQQCMERAGNTEGIAECLRLARRVSTVLSNAEQYRALVRLLTGMRRFGEMNYVFHILLDKQHFEELLSKEATRDNRLKIAILEYLTRYRPEDQETLEMVTAYFSMMRESAEAKEKKSVALIKSWCRKVTAATDTRQSLLEDAVHALVFATEEYLRLQCHRQARKCFRKAQLCALQSRVDKCRLLRGRADELTRWVECHPDFYEAYVVCESAGLQPRPWVGALWEQVVVRGDTRYLAKFTDYIHLDRVLVSGVGKSLRHHLAAEAASQPSSFPLRQPVASGRHQLVQNFRFLLYQCDDVRLVTDLSREFGIASG